MKVSSGCKEFDEFLNGGYSDITTMYGAAATGKTTFAILSAIEQAKRGHNVLYIDVENNFSVQRFKQLSGECYKELLDNLLIVKINNFREQQLRIKSLFELQDKVSLIVIDNIGGYYRRLLKSKQELANRMFISQFRILEEVSKKVPVLITNQVYTDAKNGEMRVVGGEIVKKSSDYIIELKNERVRKAILRKPERKIFLFQIKNDGIDNI